ncbi:MULTISPECIES: hypothetical protein [unclassified Corynebacterium]|uniref:hypothetical protein n=1 Tax=unclassified Corynebacterium TaxID=2624378 RepID=UPI0029CAA120|nr:MULTISPECIES: hypothetical protein [unclassified Corynebacterium]WPF65419.1 hypothetical protein OLX12_07490 [Corynebacterium sp. 22KM0430]WPF67915.1 hypothetical protein OLW90_07485 [Corynebacterium sp. 21KM1197]
MFASTTPVNIGTMGTVAASYPPSHDGRRARNGTGGTQEPFSGYASSGPVYLLRWFFPILRVLRARCHRGFAGLGF